MIEINFKEQCGKYCVRVDDGNSLYNEFETKIERKGDILLDFTGVETLTTSFLNAAVGKMVGKLGGEEFEKRVNVRGMDEVDKNLLNLVIENAKEHFSKTKDEKEKENKIVRDTLDEE